MAEANPGAGGPDRPQAQPEPHAAAIGWRAASLKEAYARLPDALRHHPAVLEQQKQRAEDVQLRVADWITGFAGSMNFVYLHIALFAAGCCSSSGARGRR
jgi:hypothetical protein